MALDPHFLYESFPNGSFKAAYMLCDYTIFCYSCAQNHKIHNENSYPSVHLYEHVNWLLTLFWSCILHKQRASYLISSFWCLKGVWQILQVCLYNSLKYCSLWTSMTCFLRFLLELKLSWQITQEFFITLGPFDLIFLWGFNILENTYWDWIFHF